MLVFRLASLLVPIPSRVAHGGRVPTGRMARPGADDWTSRRVRSRWSGAVPYTGRVRSALLIFSAVAMGALIAWLGITALRVVSGPGPRERSEPEDVEELDVYLVCGECGTELRMTRLGELQVPRHCGEPMRLERRLREG